VEDVLADAELRVERDRGVVAVVGLHEHDPAAALGGEPLHGTNERGRDTAPALRGIDGEVIDVELASCLLELRQHIAGEATDNRIARERGDRDERVAREQRLEVGVVGLSRGVRRVADATASEATVTASSVADAVSACPTNATALSATTATKRVGRER